MDVVVFTGYERCRSRAVNQVSLVKAQVDLRFATGPPQVGVLASPALGLKGINMNVLGKKIQIRHAIAVAMAFTIVLAASSALGASVSSVHAPTVFTDDKGQMIGINNIDLGSRGLWNVTFNSSWPGTEYDSSFVTAATNELGALFMSGGEFDGSEWDLSPERTWGCEWARKCVWVTKDATGPNDKNLYPFGSFTNDGRKQVWDSVRTSYLDANFADRTYGLGELSFLKWTKTSEDSPEPPTPVEEEATVVTDDKGQMIGINSVDLGSGGLWDVTFNSSWPGTEYDSSFVTAATDELADLFVGNGKLGGSEWDLFSERTLGCENATGNTRFCLWSTKDKTGPTSENLYRFAALANFGNIDGWDSVKNGHHLEANFADPTYGEGEISFLKWTPSQ